MDLGRLEEIKARYAEEIIAALDGTPGCLYAGLVQNVHHPDQAVSLTLWERPAQAEAYTRSGLFDRLLDLTKPYFAESFDWKVHLSDSYELEYQSVPAEPVIAEYGDIGEEPVLPSPAIRNACPFFRFVSMLVQPGKGDEFQKIYADQVLPTLTGVTGCCFAQLARNVRNRNEFVSFTVWSSREAAENYELGGLFTLLKDVLRPTLTALSQWKMDVEGKPGQLTATSEDITVKAYTILVGRMLGGL
jgi:quinol monooxygenase YgiN